MAATSTRALGVRLSSATYAMVSCPTGPHAEATSETSPTATSAAPARCLDRPPTRAAIRIPMCRPKLLSIAHAAKANGARQREARAAQTRPVTAQLGFGNRSHGESRSGVRASWLLMLTDT